MVRMFCEHSDRLGALPPREMSKGVGGPARRGSLTSSYLLEPQPTKTPPGRRPGGINLLPQCFKPFTPGSPTVRGGEKEWRQTIPIVIHDQITLD